MKTAEEWMQIYELAGELMPNEIRAIQADALKTGLEMAAAIAREEAYADESTMNRISDAILSHRDTLTELPTP